MAGNEMVQVMRSRMDDLLRDYKKLNSEQAKIAKSSSSINRDQQQALKTLRSEAKATQKEMLTLDQSIRKAEAGHQKQAKAIKQTGEEAKKAGRSTGDWLNKTKAGAAAALGVLQQMASTIDQVNKAQATFSQTGGEMRLRLSNALAGMGISGQAQTDLIRRIEQMPAATNQADLTQFVESLPAGSASPNQVLGMLGNFGRLGGSQGALGGQYQQTYGALFAQFGRRYSTGDLADFTLQANDMIGQEGLTPELTKNMLKLAEYLGPEKAMALTTIFGQARQGEALNQVASLLAKGSYSPDILAGTDELLTPELKTAIGAARQSTGRGDLARLYEERTAIFTGLRGDNSAVAERLYRMGDQPRQELVTRGMERNLETARLMNLDSTTDERRRLIQDQGIRELQRLQAEGLLEKGLAGAQDWAAGFMGDSYWGAVSGARSTGEQIERRSREAVEVKVINAGKQFRLDREYE